MADLFRHAVVSVCGESVSERKGQAACLARSQSFLTAELHDRRTSAKHWSG
jgi:hypothetical protein